jgi:hypothetical protein
MRHLWLILLVAAIMLGGWLCLLHYYGPAIGTQHALFVRNADCPTRVWMSVGPFGPWL